MLQMRLSPLKQVELILGRALSTESSQPLTDDAPSWRTKPAPEVSIRGGSGWKNLLKRRRGSQARYATTQAELDNARQILDACKDDIVALWESPTLHVLEEQGVDLHHHAR